MKTSLLRILALLALPLTPAFSQATPPPPQIGVSGSAEVNVAPDEIRLSVGVETRDPQNAAQEAGGPSDAAGDTLSVGQISVSASVNVTFLIQ